MAAEEGFEPSQTESESAVLPLHNSASILKTAWIIIDIFRPFVKGFVAFFPGFRKILVVLIAAGWKACYNNKGKPVEKTDRQKHVKTKRCCQKETRNGANTRIEQHLKGIMLAQICSKNRHKRTVEEKNEKI